MSKVESIRKPPSDIEAEKAVLGAMILSPKAVEVVLGICSEDNFFREAHRFIFSAIRSLYAEQTPIDTITLVRKLGAELLQKIGGVSAITDMVMFNPTPDNAEHYARIVSECAAKRTIISGVTRVAGSLYQDGDLDEAAAVLSELSMRPTNKTIMDTPDKYIPKVLDGLEKVWDGAAEKFVPSGYADFDNQVGGWEVGGLTLVAGDPKAGKTTFILNSAASMAKKKRPVGFMEMDLPKEDIPKRWICSQVDYTWRRLHTHDKTMVDRDLIQKKAQEWAALPFYLAGQEEVGTNFEDIVLMARRWKRLYDIRALFIDSIQSMRFKDMRGLEGESLVAAQATALVSLAVKLNIAIIGISEYSNNYEIAAKHRFKGSGTLKYAATLGLTLERVEDPETGNPSDWLLVETAWERNQGHCRIPLRGKFEYYWLYTPDHNIPDWVMKKKKKKSISS